MSNVGVTIKEYLKSNGITQQEVADRLGKSQQQIAIYLSGKKNFGKSMAKAFADEFGFDYAFLLTGVGTLMADDKIIQQVRDDVNKVCDIPVDIQLVKAQAKIEILESQNKQLQEQLNEANKTIARLEILLEDNKKEMAI